MQTIADDDDLPNVSVANNTLIKFLEKSISTSSLSNGKSPWINKHITNVQARSDFKSNMIKVL